MPAAQPAAAGAIVPDDEFDKAIPSLDGKMESIQDWEAEQQKAEEEAVRATGGVPVRQSTGDGSTAGGKEPSDPALPAYMDGDTSEELPDVAPLDADLEQPLQPLSSFDLEPVDAKAFGEDPEEDRQLRYHWRIDGLTGLQGTETEGDISGQFKQHSALDDHDGDAVNGAELSSYIKTDRQLLADVLNAAGHFDAVVEPAIELPAVGTKDPVTAILEVQPGPQYSFGAIELKSLPLVPADLLSSSFPLKTGKPILAEDVLAAEAGVAVTLPRNGYPFAVVGQRDILLDEAARTGDYTLPIVTGPRARFGEIVVTAAAGSDVTIGNGGKKKKKKKKTLSGPVFAPDHIYQLARFKRGDLYDARKVDDLREALVATGLFAVVAVEPLETDRPAADDTVYADLAVRQAKGPPRSISVTGGYGTGQGFSVSGSWTHRNLFPPEGALILTGVAGTQEQGASATFRRSNAGQRDRSVALTLSALHNNYDAFDAYTGKLAGQISRDSTPIWQKKLTYSYGFELLATAEKAYDFDLAESVRRTYYVAALPGQVGFDTTNDLLDPTRGFRLALKLSPEAALGGIGTTYYARGMIEGSIYQPAGPLVLAGRLRVGSIVGAAREDIAPSRRYYAGGGGSVRGFGYQQLGPKDPNDDPIGGRSVVEGAAEARYRFGNYGVVAFVDAGQVSESSTPGFDDIRMGVGVGGRFYTNFGPIRLDVATPLKRRAGESKVAIYVSIGQAF
ncbi:MAG: BamA/TamA family outer membrane protein [Candidatus Andeanibacterium colombiense]|uniref:BamA/TamA family outer membrane protein n=1 Tax=Candidatus Andeanibacterium colombiense TaxID=3121345 RepID=A0AAJ5XBM1_9SPHN|nr:MAG: BamA/TamA family outer membrane protein [Sphingomonadaceae bacterium]